METVKMKVKLIYEIDVINPDFDWEDVLRHLVTQYGNGEKEEWNRHSNSYRITHVSCLRLRE